MIDLLAAVAYAYGVAFFLGRARGHGDRWPDAFKYALAWPFVLLGYGIIRLACACVGHDWFNGGEHCRDCHKPRPAGWTPDRVVLPFLVLSALLLAAPVRATTYTLTVSTVGPVTPLSVVTSTPSGIVCPGSACSAAFSSGTVVTLGEVTASTVAFAGWSSDGANSDQCDTNLPSCSVTVTATASTITAHFDPTVSISISGNGLGVVISSVTGIVISTCDYSAGCASGALATIALPMGTTVQLVESTGPYSSFTGWSGDPGCGTASTCTITLNGYEAIVATFTASASAYPLRVVIPTGGGTVLSNPAGITCPWGVCTSTFTANTTITLSTYSAAGYYFAGWANGGCSGKTACVVTSTSPLQGLGGNQSPAAFFYPITP